MMRARGLRLGPLRRPLLVALPLVAATALTLLRAHPAEADRSSQPPSAPALHAAQSTPPARTFHAQKLTPVRPPAWKSANHAVATPAAHEGETTGAEHRGQGEEEDEAGPPGPVNWWHGLLGTKRGVTPNLLWRSPSEPPPFIASFLNFALLVFIFVRFGRKPLADALARRKAKLMHEIEQAQKLKAEAEARLRGYQTKIERLEEEIERIRRELREQGELERERIVREANERSARMLKDAEILVAHELEQMRNDVLRETVDAAFAAAAELVAVRVTAADHERLAEAFLADLSGGPNHQARTNPRPSIALQREQL